MSSSQGYDALSENAQQSALPMVGTQWCWSPSFLPCLLSSCLYIAHVCKSWMQKKKLEQRERWRSRFEEFVVEVLLLEWIHIQKKNTCSFLLSSPTQTILSEKQLVNCGQVLAGLESSICNVLFCGKLLLLSPAPAHWNLSLRKKKYLAKLNCSYIFEGKFPVWGQIQSLCQCYISLRDPRSE